MYSLYISVPFCRARCAYCDFNSYAGLEHLLPAYARALAKEIRSVGAAAAESQAHTIYFGGGTPSLMPLPELALILAAAREAFTLASDCEITLEANPGTVDGAYLAGLRALGVNRLSLGVQSARAVELSMLGRIHTFEQAVDAVRLARAAGLDNLNLDLIMGLPGQMLPAWQDTLRRALDLHPEHLSGYILSLDENTRLHTQVASGQLPRPDPDLAADMYEWASETLEADGLQQYEISNWARDKERAKDDQPSSSPPVPFFASRHNLTYWRTLPYLGFGAGAHGCADGWRYSNVLTPQAYLEHLEGGTEMAFPFSPALAVKIAVGREETMDETMMLGLRLVQEGVANEAFERRFGISLGQRYGKVLKALAEQGLVEWTGLYARLTRQGRLLGNLVFREFV
jgi:oxygen-independent coproporphyrinogen-3 oxidase